MSKQLAGLELLAQSSNVQQEEVTTLPSTWPDPLAEEAYYGLAGNIVRLMEPHTEADPAALLFSFLVMFGSVIGRSAHFIAEADKHYMNLFVTLAGPTSKGRKGTSQGQTLRLYESVDMDWTKHCIKQGLSSGEGLLWAVRDEQRETKTNKMGEQQEVIVVDGVEDKRLLVIESEFASALRVLRREGNTLSAMVRNAWDNGSLNVLTKNSPAQATGAHISILGHITKDELLRYLDNTEAGNGFGNRFLWVCVRRSKCLPEGGKLHHSDFTRIIQKLAAAVNFAQKTGEMKRDEEARSLWHEIYPDLSEGKPGLLGAMIARAEAQVMRLACIYALLDMSAVVRREHLQAAVACWQYCEDSARFIFGEALGDPVADEILKALKGAENGLTRTDISKLFGRNKGAAEIGRALTLLGERGLARSCKDVSEEGRPAQRWFATNPNK